MSQGLPAVPHARPANFEDLAVGQDWGVHEWVAAPDFCAAWCRMAGDVSASYLPTSGSANGHGGALVPPSLAFVFVAEAIKALMPLRPEGGVHARQQFAFLAPMLQGERMHTSLRISEKYVRKGRLMVESKTETRNADGRLLLTGTRLVVWSR